MFCMNHLQIIMISDVSSRAEAKKLLEKLSLMVVEPSEMEESAMSMDKIPRCHLDKLTILGGNHSYDAHVAAFQDWARALKETDPEVNLAEKDPLVFDLFTKTCCTVYFNLDPATASLVSGVLL